MEELWSKDKVMMLAELMREEVVVWDRTHPDYRKNIVKADAYRRLSTALGGGPYSPEEVKSKCAKIIAQFIRERKREQQPSGSGSRGGAAKDSSWFLYNTLIYLKDIAEIRTTINSTEPSTALVNVREVNIQNDTDNTVDNILNEQLVDEVELQENTVTPPLKKRSRREIADSKIIEIASDIATSLRAPEIDKTEDQCAIFGRLVAAKLREFDDDNREILQISIQQTIRDLKEQLKNEGQWMFNEYSTSVIASYTLRYQQKRRIQQL